MWCILQIESSEEKKKMNNKQKVLTVLTEKYYEKSDKPYHSVRVYLSDISVKSGLDFKQTREALIILWDSHLIKGTINPKFSNKSVNGNSWYMLKVEEK